MLVNQRSKNQVHMIRHYNGYVEFIADAVITQARFDRDLTSFGRQDPTGFRTEGDEMRSEIVLDVRKVAAVGLHSRLWQASNI